jgi:hypothetical protein
MVKKIVLGVVLGVIIGGILIQFIPYGHDHTNPAVAAEPNWDSPQTRDLAVRACYDCHSNQTIWPWYSNLAPVSWLIQHDVVEGRSKLNFTDWNAAQPEADNAARQVQRGQMPQSYYVMLHPSANLTAAEKAALIKGLEATTAGGGN